MPRQIGHPWKANRVCVLCYEIGDLQPPRVGRLSVRTATGDQKITAISMLRGPTSRCSGNPTH